MTNVEVAKKSEAQRLRDNDAITTLNRHMSKIYGTTPNLSRVYEAIRNWPRCDFSAEGQRPRTLHIPNLKAAPVHSVEECSWVPVLTESHDVIVEEYHLIRQYRALHPRPELVRKGVWEHIYLYSYGERMPACDLAPHTTSLIESIPTLNAAGGVFFSILAPNTALKPHFGEFNHRLRLQLPLSLSGDSYLSVHDERRRLQMGRPIAFDDSYLHWSENKGDSDRVVLICDFWHPDLTAEEQDAISAILPYFMNNRARVEARLIQRG